MKCCKCGSLLPDGSQFCQFCGQKQLPQNEPAGFNETIHVPAEENTFVPGYENQRNQQRFCKKCGQPISPETSRCTGCGKKYSKSEKKNGKASRIVLTIFLVLSVLINLLQCSVSENTEQSISLSETEIKTLEDKIAAQNTKISELESELSEKEQKILEHESTINSQSNAMKILGDAKDYFEFIRDESRYSNIGYAASNFRASESIIVVKKSETNRKFTLTANWPNHGNVFIDYTGDAAFVSLDKSTWSTSTTVTVDPQHVGVTAVNFSNNKDSNKFKVFIIVTE